MLRVPCPKCDTVLQAGEESAGQVVRCPNCQTMMRIASQGAAGNPSTQVAKRPNTGLPAGAPPPPAPKPTARKTGAPPPGAGNRAPHPRTVLEPPPSAPAAPAARAPAPNAVNSPPPTAFTPQRLPATTNGMQQPLGPPPAPRLPARPGWGRRLALCGLLVLLLSGGGAAYYWLYARETIDTLLHDLDAADSQARSNAAERLGKMGPEAQEAVEKLITKLADDDAKVRDTVKEALNKIGPPADTAMLRRYLHDDSPDTRLYCAETLADKVKEASLEDLQALDRAFKDPRNLDHPDIRGKVMKALVKFASQDTDLVLGTILDRGLRDPAPKVAEQAEDGLKQFAGKALKNKELRERAFREIVERFKIRDPHAVLRASLDAAAEPPPLKAAFDELNKWTGNIDKDFDVLKKYLEHRDVKVRGHALRLITAASTVPDRAVVVRALLRGLGDAGTRRMAEDRLLKGRFKLNAKHDLPVIKKEIITASFFANRDVVDPVHCVILQEIARAGRDDPERSWAVDVLTKSVQRKDLGASVRTAALKGLEPMLDGSTDFAILSGLAKHPAWDDVRLMAVTKLARVDLAAEGVAVLTDVLKTERKLGIRQMALAAFTRPDAKPEMVRPALVAALGDSENTISEQALEKLKKLPPPTTIDAAGLRAARVAVQQYTAYTAGRLGRSAVAVLREALNHSANEVRRVALDGMKDKDGKFDVDLIEKELNLAEAKYEDVRLGLVKALAAADLTLGRARLLRERVEKDEVKVRMAALQAFTAFASRKPPGERKMVSLVRSALVVALEDKAEAVRGKALVALKELPAPDASEANTLAKLLQVSGQREVHVYAAKALRDIAPKEKEAVDALMAALDSEDGEVVSFCAEALGKIGQPAAEAVPKLVEVAAKKEMVEGRRKALSALIAIGGVDRASRVASVKALKTALKDAGAGALQKLAADGIVQIGNKGDFKALADKVRAEDTGPAFCQEIVESLARCSKEKLSSLDGEDAADLTRALLEALPRQVKSERGEWKEVMKAYAYRDSDPKTFADAVENATKPFITVLSGMREGAVSALIAEVKREDESKGRGNRLVLWVAARALGEMGPGVGNEARNLLNRLGNRASKYKHPDPLVRKAANDAVRKINKGSEDK